MSVEAGDTAVAEWRTAASQKKLIGRCAGLGAVAAPVPAWGLSMRCAAGCVSASRQSASTRRSELGIPCVATFLKIHSHTHLPLLECVCSKNRDDPDETRVRGLFRSKRPTHSPDDNSSLGNRGQSPLEFSWCGVFVSDCATVYCRTQLVRPSAEARRAPWVALAPPR